MSKPQIHHDKFEDDGIVFQAEDAYSKIIIRVGQVFYRVGKDNEFEHKDFGIWINVIDKDGPDVYDRLVLLSQSTWSALNKHVKKRFRSQSLIGKTINKIKMYWS